MAGLELVGAVWSLIEEDFDDGLGSRGDRRYPDNGDYWRCGRGEGGHGGNEVERELDSVAIGDEPRLWFVAQGPREGSVHNLNRSGVGEQRLAETVQGWHPLHAGREVESGGKSVPERQAGPFDVKQSKG